MRPDSVCRHLKIAGRVIISRFFVCFRQGCINSWPGSGCYTAAPFVSLPAAAGAAGVRTWGVRRHSLLRRIRYIRFAMRPVPPMVLLCLICDVLGSPIFKQRPNEDQRRLVRISWESIVVLLVDPGM